jgi:hypothetical protein
MAENADSQSELTKGSVTCPDSLAVPLHASTLFRIPSKFTFEIYILIKQDYMNINRRGKCVLYTSLWRFYWAPPSTSIIILWNLTSEQRLRWCSFMRYHDRLLFIITEDCILSSVEVLENVTESAHRHSIFTFHWITGHCTEKYNVGIQSKTLQNCYRPATLI